MNFTSSTELPVVYTGDARINATNETITFNKPDGTAYQAVSYADASFADASGTISKAVFVAKINADAANGKYSDVTSTRNADGKYHFVYRGTSAKNLPVNVVNNKPVDVAVDRTYQVGAGTQTIAITSLATDADATDTLSFVGTVGTTNAAVAQALTSGSNLVLSVGNTPGKTTITVNVTDGKDTTTVSFDVTVTPVTYLTTAGTPASDYVAPTPAPITIAAPTVTTAGNLVVTVGTNTPVNVHLVDGLSLDQIVAAINTAAGSLVTAAKSSNGNDLEVTAKTAADLTLASDGTLVGNNIAANYTDTEAIGTGTAAKYAFEVKTAITAASGITVEVKIGNETVTLEEGTDFTGAATTGAVASALATKLNTELTGKYTVAVSGSTVVLTQVTPAPTAGITLSVTAQ